MLHASSEDLTQIPARRGLARLADVTSTVEETTYTFTSTVTQTAAAPTFTETGKSCFAECVLPGPKLNKIHDRLLRFDIHIVSFLQAFACLVFQLLTHSLISYPPVQTVCDDSDSTVTVYYQGPARTDYQVQFVTYNTWATAWVG